MYTLNDFIKNLEEAKEAINSIEVKGRQNALYVIYANDKCDNMIQSLKDAIAEQVKTQEEGDINGKLDPAVSS